MMELKAMKYAGDTPYSSFKSTQVKKITEEEKDEWLKVKMTKDVERKK